ncbi:hypothetical protein FWH30_01295 [Microgenomates group bacterium]|nr:hypothetical protein [Microgenomates group bacterium]
MADAKKKNLTPKKSGAEKEFLPFVLPLLAIVVVIFLGWQWISLRTKDEGVVPETSEKIEITEISADEQAKLDNIAKGLGDFRTSVLTQKSLSLVGAAQVRYDFEGDKVYANVIANLPSPAAGTYYQVYLKEGGSEEWQKSEALALSKSGYLAQFVSAAGKLPIGVRVTLESAGTPAGENVLFEGEISAQ